MQILFLLLILISCSSKCRQWHLEDPCAAYPCYPLSKLYLPATTEYNGIELELTRSGNDIRMYANVYSLPLPASSQNPNKTDFILTVDNVNYEYSGDRLEGDQRLLLPQEAISLILTTLFEGKCLQMTIGRYKTEIVPENFIKLYNQNFIY